MRRVAFLVPGSRNASFYSQIAVLDAAIRLLPWRRWLPTVHAYFGGDDLDLDPDCAWRRFSPFLRNVRITDVSKDAFRLKGNWAQADATLELAPRDADVLVSLDADTLPVAGFEDVLDRVADGDLVAGVIAHYPPPPGETPRADWKRVAEGVVSVPLAFSHRYTLIEPDDRDERWLAPFYVNGGVMFYGRKCFDRFVPMFLDIRSKLSTRMSAEAFTGQVASTLAVAECGLQTWALPMRYNFPNDPLAHRMYPRESENVVIHHYLRTTSFDRQSIFTSPEAFNAFLDLSLQGADLLFQNAVRRIFLGRYPLVASATPNR